MRRIGTGLRKWSFSLPRRRVTTRPASSSCLRCFMTPKRLMENLSSNAPRVCPSSRNSSSRSSLRVGSASALNTSSTSGIICDLLVTCQDLWGGGDVLQVSLERFPTAGDPLEGHPAAVFEVDPRPVAGVAHIGRHEQLTALGAGAQSLREVDGESGEVVTAHVDHFSHMHASAHLEPEVFHGPGGGQRAPDCGLGLFECHEKAVPGALHLLTPD